MRIKQLHWQIFIALILSIAISVVIKLLNAQGSSFAFGLVSTCDFLGHLFMNALKMVIVPLVISSIICGVMGLGKEDDFGRMAFKTILYYVTTGIAAVIVALILVNIIRPGIVDPATAENILGQAQGRITLAADAETRAVSDMVEIFFRMVPPNILMAATDNGQLLGLITFSLVFGFFISKLPRHLRTLQQNLWESVQSVMMMITDMIIKAAPIGVFGLVTPIVMRTGFDLFQPVLMFFITVVLALALNMFVILGFTLKYIGKVDPVAHFRAMAPVLLTSFSTSSSASTLPVTIETVERDAKVSNRTACFTLPLGATVNMSGTALYECIVVVFIAQIYGVLQGYQMGLADQILVVLMAWLTSVGVAGIPAASLVAITVILGAVGLPVEAVGIVWVTDRILDMARTMVNVFSDTCAAVVIARTEGERTAYPLE